MTIASAGTDTLYENAATTSIVVPVPSGVATGDVLVAAVTMTKDTNGTQRTLTAPAGWTAFATAQTSPNTGTIGEISGLFYHVVSNGGSEPADYTWTHDSTADRCTGAMRRYTGVDVVTPEDVAASTVSYANVSNTTVIIPSITTVTNGAMLVSMVALHSASVHFSAAPAGFTQINTSTGTGRVQHWADAIQATAGATGTETWTKPAGSERRLGILAALRPAAGATPVTATDTGALAEGSSSVTATPGTADAVVLTETSSLTVGGTTTLASTDAAALAELAALSAPFTRTDSAALSEVASATPVSSTAPTLLRRVVGPTGIIKTRTADCTSVRIKLGTDTAVTLGVVYTAGTAPDATTGVATVRTTGLASGVYFYRVVMTDTAGSEWLDTATDVGRIVIAPVGQTNFAFCFSSCCNATDSAAMTKVAARADDLFLHVGDLFYQDPLSPNVANYRTYQGQKLEVANHAKVFATTPSTYTWSDHDFGFENNATGGNTAAAIAPANQVYRENFPVDPEQSTTGIYHEFLWGRIQFIVMDCRTFKTDQAATDNSAKTILGATQKQWVKDTITDSTAAAIVLVSDCPWTGAPEAGGDHWGGYNTERQELASHITASGKKVVVIAGDTHVLAHSTGITYAQGIPGFQASPLNNTSSIKADPWDATYPAAGVAGTQQYGRVVVTDTGSSVTLAFTGYDSGDVSRVTASSVVTFKTATDTPALTEASSVGLSESLNLTASDSMSFSESASLATSGGALKTASDTAALSEGATAIVVTMSRTDGATVASTAVGASGSTGGVGTQPVYRRGVASVVIQRTEARFT